MSISRRAIILALLPFVIGLFFAATPFGADDDVFVAIAPTLSPVFLPPPSPPAKVPVSVLDFRHCDYRDPEEALYKASLLSARALRRDLAIGETGLVEVRFRNDGNVRWFAAHSGCADSPAFFLGTRREQDAPSALGVSIPNLSAFNWLNENFNRVTLAETFVDPGEEGTFRFTVKAPERETVYRQYFAAVVEGVTWLEESEFALDLFVGEPAPEVVAKLPFIDRSLDLGLLAEDKSVEVDLKAQQTHLFYGDRAVATFTVSTGAPQTPTPRGDFQIHKIEDLRISGGRPRYLMPNYLSLVKNGAFGFHALPSLRNDQGVFWTEALNHIGQAVSHGCIRLLPADSEKLKNFVSVGTPVSIYR